MCMCVCGESMDMGECLCGYERENRQKDLNTGQYRDGSARKYTNKFDLW